jgi:hypothetical protein
MMVVLHEVGVVAATFRRPSVGRRKKKSFPITVRSATGEISNKLFVTALDSAVEVE